MAAAVLVNRTDVTVADVRAAAAATNDASAARRLLAIALVMDGSSRETAAASCAMDRQTLRDWVHRFNDDGPDGLSDRPRSGRPSLLNTDHLAELERWVEAGPDVKKDGIVRWRRVDLRDKIKAKFGVTMHERTVGKLLRKLEFRRLSVRPQHPKSDPAAQEAFKNSFNDRLCAAVVDHLSGKPIEVPIELWFQDEARVGQQGTLTRIWAKRGTRPRAVRDHRFTSAYLFGAVCPERGTGAAVIMPKVNLEAMMEHLAEISRCVGVGAIAVLVLDGASWHSSAKLIVPDNIVLLPLPAYSPELNPAENIWEFIRSNYLSHRVFNSYEAIVNACVDAWNKLMKLPATITSIASRDWAKVNI